jgi:hypothetical protein
VTGSHADREIFMLVCRQCGDGHLVMPFRSAAERGKWAAAHTEGTGHDKWRVADNLGEMAQLVTTLTLTAGN